MLISIFKLLAAFAFIGIGLYLNINPNNEGYQGFRYWKDPGAFTTWIGFSSVVVVAAFAFSGVEVCSLCVAESREPMRDIPTAIKGAFWRIAVVNNPSPIYTCISANNDRS